MKKILSLILALFMVFSVTIPSFAAETSEESENTDYSTHESTNDEEIADLLNAGFTVEIVPNEEIEATLPEYLRDALNDEIATYGISKPSISNTYDLRNGKYNFSVDTVLETTIYSKYVFIGHEGNVKFYINDTSTDSGGYTIKVYKKGLIDTRIYSKTYSHDDAVSFSLSFNDADAKIYFAIVPEGTTRIGSNSYIAKG